MNARVHLSEIRKGWNRFYEATEIDHPYGHLFRPLNVLGDRMRYCLLEPEVAGGLGANTKLDTGFALPWFIGCKGAATL